MSSGIERRRYPRAKVDFAIRVDDAISIIETRAKDVSCSGLYCQTERSIPVMTKVAATLLLPLQGKSGVAIKEIKCVGVVVRSQLKAQRDEFFYDTAIFFTHLRKDDEKRIARYVEYKLLKEAT